MANDTPHSEESPKKGFFTKDFFIRFFMTIFLLMGLFFFIHVREVKVPMFEPGMIASHYVVADIPFTYEDEEATAIARQEALLDIGKIYAIDQEDIVKRRVEFENSLVYDQAWREASPQSTFDEMCRASEKLERTLLEIRFTDPRTLEKMSQLGFDISLFHEIAPVDTRQGVYFPDKIWDFIRERSFPEHSFQPATLDFVVAFFRDKIWALKEDMLSARRIRKIVQDQVPHKYTFIPAGRRIIEGGERITSHHIIILQAMKEALAAKKDLYHYKTIGGSLLLALLLVFVPYFFLKRYYPKVLYSSTAYSLIVTTILLSLSMAKGCELLLLRSPHTLLDFINFPLLTPFSGILLATLINANVAVFLTAILAALFETCLAFDSEAFLLANLLVGFVTIISTRTLRRRTEIVTICFKGFLIAALIILAFSFYDRSKAGMAILTDIGGAGIFMLLTAILVVGLLPLFEMCFHVLTDINLMEYMDPNHELLRKLMVEAPGTYQHALILGGIAENAAQAIGANGLFCRVATLYHDIGKISIAQYFTENQQTGMNIHQLLTPVESARVIISHVNDGVLIGRKARLPEPFIDIIKEHHGTSLVYYFYHKQLEAVGHDPTQINEKDFRYLGPKPRTKESAIIMLADSFEAACRSLDEVNEEILIKLADQIVREKMDDGQLDDCQLTFEEIGKIKKAMVKSLLSIGHFRIKYPSKIKPKTPPL